MPAPTYTTATGCLSTPAALLQHSLANCAAFQTWVAADDADEALARIYSQGIPLPEGDDESYSIEQMEAMLPFALIYLTSFETRSDATGGNGWEWGVDSGTLELVFYKLIPAKENDPGELERLLLNTAGEIIDELKSLAGTGGHFAATRFSTPGVYRVTEEEAANGELPTARLPITVTWGNDGGAA